MQKRDATPLSRNTGDSLSATVIDETAIAAAAQKLRAGGLVAMPTETVYGLAANAFDSLAVARIFDVKQRPHFDPLIVHVGSFDDLERIASQVSEDARRLCQRFWPGPLTVVLPKHPEVPDLVTAGLPTVAIRMPAHPVALALIRAAGFPLAAPSANPFGYISPTTAEHVRRQLGGKVDTVLDGGACAIGIESTIIGWHHNGPSLLRAGGLPTEEIEAIIGKLQRGSVPTLPHDPRPEAPGQLLRHYSPRTPMLLLETPDQEATPQGAYGWLGLHTPRNPEAFRAVEILSESGDLREAAANLFSAMHRLDALGLDGIIARPLPERGLGRAINDRLRRAAARD